MGSLAEDDWDEEKVQGTSAAVMVRTTADLQDDYEPGMLIRLLSTVLLQLRAMSHNQLPPDATR